MAKGRYILPRELELPRTNIEYRVSVPGTTKFNELRFRFSPECQLRNFIKTACDMFNVVRELGPLKKTYSGLSEISVSTSQITRHLVEKFEHGS